MGSETLLGQMIARRKFLGTAALAAGALSLGAICDPAMIRRLQQQKNALPPRHLAWVWQFTSDGVPEQIATNLAANGMAVTLKTHDGTDWMSKYDHSGSAVSGPAQIERLARMFEDMGVPFHAWSVIKGHDPIREAQMAYEVLQSGARSLTLDLEGSAGFWIGSRDDALRFGEELRRLTPFGRVDISIDPRPWRIYLGVPMVEFVAFTDAIWPQLYWDTFQSPANRDYYRNAGYDPGNHITPEFLLDATFDLLKGFEREIIPVGQGAALDPYTWDRFNMRAWELGHVQVSTWRFGVTPYATLEYLGDNPAGRQPAPPRVPVSGTPTRTPTSTHTTEPTRTRTPTKTPKPATNTPVPTRTHTPTATAAPFTSTPTVAANTATSVASATLTAIP